MPRLSIARLPKATRKVMKRLDAAGFETEKACRSQDKRRAKLLKSAAKTAHQLVDPSKAKNLSKRLMRAAEGRSTPPTVASRLHCREHRRRITSALVKLARRYSSADVKTFTVVSGAWTVTPAELMEVDARKMLNAIRSDLNRCGAADLGGAIFLAIDGDFEVSRELYQLHVHGVALGAKCQAIEALRARSKYGVVDDLHSTTLPIHRPILVKGNVTEYPRAFSYTFKSFWPAKILVDTADGGLERKRCRRPIPEPFHSLSLLWLDQWTVEDVTLLMGMAVNKSGFHVRKR